jgi:hypothetical protein
VSALSPHPMSYRHLEDTPRAGDICALLVPNYNQSSSIRAKLETLREQFGGSDVMPLHVLCQRFRADKARLESLKPHLKTLVQTTTAVNLKSLDIEPFYSTFRSRELLKCRIVVPETLQKLITSLDALLLEHGITPLNVGLPEWVTLLEDIHVGRLQPHPYEQNLFVGQRLLLSELRAPGSFKALYSFALAENEVIKTQFS